MGFELAVRREEEGLSKYSVKGIIGENLKKGKSFKDSIPTETLSDEANILVLKFSKLCEDGIDPYKAFVQVFY